VVVEAGFAGDADEKASIGFVELFPPRVLRIFDGVEETGVGGEWIVVVGVHGRCV
jgi:hypothetical protein